ncbi:MAG: hypothetical protein NC548_24355 [Lachnospiraceae bacterium]|nr:hypothetical protein [Lachnospiraceae bacterium]
MKSFRYFADAKEHLLSVVRTMREKYNEDDESASNDDELEDLDEMEYCELNFNNDTITVVLDYTSIN